MSNPQAVLFDMDGLLVDTEPLWTIAEVELATRLGGTWSDELKALVLGTTLPGAVHTILTWYGAPTAPADLSSTSSWLLARMAELLAGRVRPRAGALELAADLRAAGVPLALVSSSYRVLVDAVLGQLEVGFDVTVAGDEVMHSKPHPEPYLRACGRLGVEPTRCVVLEDAPSGVRSAEAAGCAVVAVPSLAAVHFEPAPRRTVVTSLTEVTAAQLALLAAQ